MAAGAAYQGRRAAVSGGGAGPAAWACAAAAGGARSRSAALPPHAHCPGGGGGTERPGARCQCGAGAARRGSLRHRGGNFTSPPVRRTAERGGKPRAVEGRGGGIARFGGRVCFFSPRRGGGKEKNNNPNPNQTQNSAIPPQTSAALRRTRIPPG